MIHTNAQPPTTTTTDEPELWHKPFQAKAYLKAHAIKMVRSRSSSLPRPTHPASPHCPVPSLSSLYPYAQRMHRYLLMLHRASSAFPADLRESEEGMIRAYDQILRRLQRTLEACLHEALARLMCLKRR